MDYKELGFETLFDLIDMEEKLKSVESALEPYKIETLQTELRENISILRESKSKELKKIFMFLYPIIEDEIMKMNSIELECFGKTIQKEINLHLDGKDSCFRKRSYPFVE